MSTLYLVCLMVGTAGLVCSLAWRLARRGPTGSAPRRTEGGEWTVPGARIEPSDDFAVEGGAGGAEGEGGSPGFEDEADGGVGGAEGGADERPAGVRTGVASASFTAALAGFGGAGCVLGGTDLSPSLTPVVAALVGAALGLLAVPVARAAGSGDRP